MSYHYFQGVKMIAGGVAFDLYGDDIWIGLFFFNSMIDFSFCRCWFCLFLFFFFFLLQECTQCVILGVLIFPLINL